jgi:hypothetical protein
MASQYFKNFPIVNYNGISLRNIMLKSSFLSELFLSSQGFYDYLLEDGDRPTTVAYNYYGSIDYAWLVILANQIIDPYFEWPLSSEEFDNYIITKYGSIDASRGYFDANLSGTISTSNTTVTGSGTSFTQRFRVGDYLKANSLYRKVTDIDSDTSMTIEAKFPVDLVANTHQTTYGLREYRYNDDTSNIVIDVDTFIYAYTAEGQGLFVPISDYTKEFELNEERRAIKLVEASYAPRIAIELNKSLQK